MNKRPMTQDKRLLQRIAQGDKRAFARLYDALAVDVYRYLIVLLGNQNVAEDILQETFLVVWRQAAQFREAASLKTWVLGIARNLAYSRLRSQREEWLDERTANDIVGEDGLETFARIWRKQEVAQAVAHLPAHHREALELVFGLGFSYREAAEVLGCPTGTVKSRVSYALKALRVYLRHLDAPVHEEEE